MDVSTLLAHPVALAAIAIAVLFAWKLRKIVLFLGLLAIVVVLLAQYR